jgi:uncharacterized repeat protein (TIGR01451 family)
MAVSHKVWRPLAYGLLTVMLGFVAACGDDEGALPGGPSVPGTGSITGRVTNTATGAGVVGATVGTTPATSIAITDASGNYRIDNVPEGSYAVTAQAQGFQPGSATASVVEGQTATANIALASTGGPVSDTLGTVTGLVRRVSGQPVPEGTTVSIYRASSCPPPGDTTPAFRTATTDAGGRYLIQGIARGNYIACVNVTIGGVQFSGITAFVVNAGAITQADITVGRDTGQTTTPNIGGTEIPLGTGGAPAGKFNGNIRFVHPVTAAVDSVDCNLIFSQHLWVVEVRRDDDNDGQWDTNEPVISGVRVEWSLNSAGGGIQIVGPDGTVAIRGTTGVIVDTDDPFLDPVQAESAKVAGGGATPQFKVDDTHAVTYTNDTAQTVDFGGGQVTVGVGQTWIIVTSPQEGFTDAIAFSPDISRATRPEQDKDFAIKRWINFRVQIAELVRAGGLDSLDANPIAALAGVPGGAPAQGGAAGASSVVSNRLDRTPTVGLTADPCADRRPGAVVGDEATGTLCNTSNRGFFGIVISRFRLDSPFTFTTGTVTFTITDTIPDAEIEDIDSDDTPGAAGFAGGGFIDVQSDSAAATFSADASIAFECEEDPATPTECLDIDVVNAATNTAGQDLINLGFTITGGTAGATQTGAELFEAGAVVTVVLDSTRFFVTADSTSATGFVFSPDLQNLIDERGDNINRIVIRIVDSFGEICEEIVVDKRWITSILRIFKQGPVTVSLGQRFDYTVTVVNDGETSSSNVVVADTLPILDLTLNDDRAGNQAFRYITDDPTFDPGAVRYYIDLDDDESGVVTDVCFEAPVPGFPTAFVRPPGSTATPTNAPVSTGPAFGFATCPTVTTFPTIAAARAAATAASTSTSGNAVLDQVVIIEYFDTSVLARTQPGGAIEAEDSFEVTLEAIHSVNEFRLPSGAIPTRADINGEWCNIATVTSAENDFAADSVCTRVVEALLDVRKTVSDALVPAGSETEFRIEVANNGSETLTNVTVTDTLSLTGSPDAGLVFVRFVGSLGAGVTSSPATPDTTTNIITFTVASLPSTDTNNNGVFDTGEGFTVATIRARTPLREGVFCNRVTVRATPASGVLTDTDLACVVTTVEIEFDIVNDDGLRTSAGEFQDVETFRVGDSIEYRTSITNRSAVTATNVIVLWEIAPVFRIIQFERILVRDPTTIACSTATDTCSVTVAALDPGRSIVLNYLTFAQFTGNDVNRITLRANELSLPVVNEEPTTVNP